jgi:hypothetical protein
MNQQGICVEKYNELTNRADYYYLKKNGETDHALPLKRSFFSEKAIFSIRDDAKIEVRNWDLSVRHIFSPIVLPPSEALDYGLVVPAKRGDLCFFCVTNGNFSLWDVKNGTCLCSKTIEKNFSADVKFDGTHLVLCHEDNTNRVNFSFWQLDHTGLSQIRDWTPDIILEEFKTFSFNSYQSHIVAGTGASLVYSNFLHLDERYAQLTEQHYIEKIFFVGETSAIFQATVGFIGGPGKLFEWEYATDKIVLIYDFLNASANAVHLYGKKIFVSTFRDVFVFDKKTHAKLWHYQGELIQWHIGQRMTFREGQMALHYQKREEEQLVLMDFTQPEPSQKRSFPCIVS